MSTFPLFKKGNVYYFTGYFPTVSKEDCEVHDMVVSFLSVYINSKAEYMYTHDGPPMRLSLTLNMHREQQPNDDFYLDLIVRRMYFTSTEIGILTYLLLSTLHSDLKLSCSSKIIPALFLLHHYVTFRN